ncbi:hypothetical protein BT96DRAFT_393793 [Gymnopus androsaceus JB14]|uniref:Uncharacterized protein n=1 Tax=Gymnopus androsaceus JB14 TaxID=1447944 RepID=A0A6A4GX03_9AGAR|nr:hypothetical protein BT96DRAFT_393793 [Gymnopus androsaceus JB14]
MNMDANIQHTHAFILKAPHFCANLDGLSIEHSQLQQIFEDTSTSSSSTPLASRIGRSRAQNPTERITLSSTLSPPYLFCVTFTSSSLLSRLRERNVHVSGRTSSDSSSSLAATAVANVTMSRLLFMSLLSLPQLPFWISLCHCWDTSASWS